MCLFQSLVVINNSSQIAIAFQQHPHFGSVEKLWIMCYVLRVTGYGFKKGLALD